VLRQPLIVLLLEAVRPVSDVVGHFVRFILFDIGRLGNRLIESNALIVARHPAIINTPSSTIESIAPKLPFAIDIMVRLRC
jgi:hypothetical protein